MVHFCCVNGCRKEWYPGCGLSFHRIPKDELKAEIWKKNIPGTVVKTSVLCNTHFKDEDFINKSRKRLKLNAVPSIFPKGRDDLDDADSEAIQSEPACMDFESSEEPIITDFITKNPTSQENEPDLRTINEQALKITLARIRSNPQLYIGIPKNCYHLINIIHKQTQISTTHILLCLKKVKLDTHFEELADQFGISSDEASHVFITNMPVIAKALQSFVNFGTQSNVPVPFQKSHSAIIDTLELNVQPLSFISKELTRTEKGNTVKYLICRRPDGFINYVSPGYGGRLSNEAVLENSNYLKRFKSGACVIANGFRNVEPILLKKGLKLANPRADQGTSSRKMCDETQDSTYSINLEKKALKIKKEEETIQNSSLISKEPFNEHMERVVNRVGEFSMVKECSVVSSELVRVLDDAVIISCALINLQSFVIN